MAKVKKPNAEKRLNTKKYKLLEIQLDKNINNIMIIVYAFLNRVY